MKELPIIKSSHADDDLIAIWEYIAPQNEAAATRLLLRIDGRIASLSANPNLGERLPGAARNTRRIIIDNYVAFYQVSDDCVRVIRVLHSARKWEDLL